MVMARRTMIAVSMMLLFANAAWSAGLSEADTRAIRAMTKQYVDTALAGNWDSWTSMLTEKAVFLPPNGAALEGRAAIRAWVMGFAGMATFTAPVEEVTGNDKLAFARGTYSFAMSPTARMQGGDSGKWLTIYEKQTDGSWRILRNIWNSSQPLPQK